MLFAALIKCRWKSQVKTRQPRVTLKLALNLCDHARNSVALDICCLCQRKDGHLFPLLANDNGF